MKANDEYRQQLLAELVEDSAKIYILAVKPKQSVTESLSCDQEISALRAQQQYVTQRLHALEEPVSNAWENIGDGG